MFCPAPENDPGDASLSKSIPEESDGPVSVTESDKVPSDPNSGSPSAVAILVSVCASKSSWVTTYVAEHNASSGVPPDIVASNSVGEQVTLPILSSSTVMLLMSTDPILRTT